MIWGPFSIELHHYVVDTRMGNERRGNMVLLATQIHSAAGIFKSYVNLLRTS